jgi:hypothetical protein
MILATSAVGNRGADRSSNIEIGGKGKRAPFVKAFLRNNGLSLTILALSLLFLGGQIFAGFYKNRKDQREHGNRWVLGLNI